ncbi:MAG TPA: winged helix-turn-helix transcriptional regulator [Nitrososphaeraceae archaeon]|jgi:predicted transcriptional regulator|nr:winged helix-turn-helix transcriptional regulator [Nitrososphaeraceae archaeon]
MKNMVESAFSTSFYVMGQEEDDQLSEVQSKLMKHINAQPGIRYRELLRLSSLSNGVLTYHITSLEKSGRIIADRSINNKITRYYPNNIPIEETDIIGHIRNSAARQIILFILEHDSCTFNEIIEYTKKAPSTISWHLKRLKDSGIISVFYNHTSRCQQLYKIRDFESITSILSKYKQSFAPDAIVNNYTDIMESL